MPTDRWDIRDVDEITKKKIKIYAVEHGLTLAEALKAIMAELEAAKQQLARLQKTASSK
jgi:5-bromo-4-chloroindolyl phosphate hydrolysis protein